MLRRIVRHLEYRSFLNADKSFRLPHFFVPVLMTGTDEFAYGITIQGKIGNAVLRNRLKRRTKVWFSNHAEVLPSGIKINMIALKGAAELSWQELSLEFDQFAAMIQT